MCYIFDILLARCRIVTFYLTIATTSRRILLHIYYCMNIPYKYPKYCYIWYDSFKTQPECFNKNSQVAAERFIFDNTSCECFQWLQNRPGNKSCRHAIFYIKSHSPPQRLFGLISYCFFISLTWRFSRYWGSRRRTIAAKNYEIL